MITEADRELGARMIREYEAEKKASDERIARMTPEELAILQDAADSLGRKMQSSFDPTFKNVTPPPPQPKPKRHRLKRSADAAHSQLPARESTKSQV